MKKRESGFTLIELMIVIAIIAIIAAIAIPGLLSSQRASNERNASASMKTLATGEVDFRSNDRDNDTINNFWVTDAAGLYGIEVPAGNPLKLIEVTIARADQTSAGYNQVPAVAAPKAGYWYAVLAQFEDAIAGPTAYDDGTGHNNSRFGFVAYPEAYNSSGKLVFIINEENTMFKQDGNQLGIAPPAVPAIVYPNDPFANNWVPMD